MVSSGHSLFEFFSTFSAKLLDSVASDLSSVDSLLDDLLGLGVLGLSPSLLQSVDSLLILLDEWSGVSLDQVGGALADSSTLEPLTSESSQGIHSFVHGSPVSWALGFPLSFSCGVVLLGELSEVGM